MTAGQFGSVYDTYSHRNNDHNGWLAANLKVSEKLVLHAQTVFTEASSGFSGLNLDPSGLPGQPPGFDYPALSEIQDFSNLRLRWWYFEGGIQHQVQPKLLWETNLTYDNYTDSQSYVVNTTGKRFGALARLNWFF